MDPWSKVDYSGLIRETSMVVEKLPEVNPPSSRVPGQGLLAAPILKSWRRRNRGEIAKKGYVFKGFRRRGKYRPKGGRGWPRMSRRPPGHQGAWTPSGPPLVLLRDSGTFFCADFLYFFPVIL